MMRSLCCTAILIVTFLQGPMPSKLSGVRITPIEPSAVAPNQTTIAILTRDTGVAIIDLKKDQIETRHKDFGRDVQTLNFLSTDQQLVIGLASGRFLVTDRTHNRTISEAEVGGRPLKSLVVIDDHTFATLSQLSLIEVWSLGKEVKPAEVQNSCKSLIALYYGRISRKLFAFGEEESAVFEFPQLKQSNLGVRAVSCAAESSMGQTLICGCEDGKIRVVDLQPRAVGTTVELCTRTIRSITLSPNDRVILACDTRGNVYALDVQTLELLYILELQEDLPVMCLVAADSATYLTVGRSIRCWDLLSGNERQLRPLQQQP
jgi:hypothetical protein